jgi:hypothetical protein
MSRFKHLFHVLLRKRDYVTTYTEKVIISKLRPNQKKNTFKSRLTLTFLFNCHG